MNGTLGPHIIRHLLLANFQVTALTSNLDKTTSEWGGKVNITKADYTSIATIAPSLRGHDALVSLINRDEADVQIMIIDAAIEAGVPHIIPSSFGIDSRVPEIRANPALEAKIRAEDYVIQRAAEGKISFTAIQTGMFFDWAIKAGVILDANGPTMLFDSGSTPFSVSSLDDIGRGVAGVLRSGRRGIRCCLCIVLL